ncbi:MAG: SDR family NAD(P)-dependent oxidoreductase [Pseudomonadota bacterium]
MKTAIVLGVGPEDGLGGQLCLRFGQDHHVLIAGRTREKLEIIAARIRDRGGSAEAVVADATDEAATISLFDRAGGELTLAIYNAGNNTPGKIIDMEAAYFEHSWRVCCFGGFLFGREAVRRMQGRGGTILYTGASASLRGRANFGAFNSSKAALRTFAQALAKEYAKDGVHVGHVVVDGPINGEKIRKGLPQYAEKLGEEGMISIGGIVDAYEYLYRQPRSAWSFELDIRTHLERW